MPDNEFFYNRQRSGYEELFSYMPRFWQQILEMRANNAFAGHTLDRIADALEALISDQFIDSCKEEILARFEEFMGIYPKKTDSLDQRRESAQLAWVGDAKMSRTKIKQIVKKHCDSDSNVFLTDNQLVIYMTLKGDPMDYMPRLRDMLLNSTIPAHIKILFCGQVKDIYIIPEKNDINFHALEIRTAIGCNTEKANMSVSIHVGAAVIEEAFDNATVKIQRNNLWYLDGVYNLDGSKILNAMIKKEDI